MVAMQQQYHVVCRHCRFEKLVDSEAEADATVRMHHRMTGHSTVFGEVV